MTVGNEIFTHESEAVNSGKYEQRLAIQMDVLASCFRRSLFLKFLRLAYSENFIDISCSGWEVLVLQPALLFVADYLLAIVV